MTKKQQYKCKTCRDIFVDYKCTKRQYCSVRCKVKDQKNFRQKTGEYKHCETCKTSIYVPSWAKNIKKFCSIKCARRSTQQIKISIKNLKHVNQEGKNNPRWKDGSSIYRKTAFNNIKNECFVCKQTKSLLAHHVNGDRRKCNITNLKILCTSCHNLIHKLYPKKESEIKKILILTKRLTN